MNHHLLRLLLLYFAALNASLLFLVFTFEVDPEVPWFHVGEFYEAHPGYVPYLLRHDPARCTYYCETHACTHPKRYMAWYGPVRWQTLLLDPKSKTYRQANVAVYVFGLTLLWAVLGYYALTGFRRITRRYHWAAHLLFWLFFIPQFLVAYAWAIPAQVSTVFDACVVFCVKLAWALGVSLHDVYVLLFTFTLPGVTGLLFVAALARWVWTRRGRRVTSA
jgi:hypothetical protein